MSRFDAERLLTLLPSVYRLRDAGLDPLRAFLGVLAEEIGNVEENIEQLYDDQFIETCADWVVPYIGDLVGLRTLPLPLAGARFSSGRAEVANAIAYRRRKGSAAMLEQLARDVTGWPAHLVEYFQVLFTTQHTNHVRPLITMPDLRRMPELERSATPFDSLAHTLDVRRIASRRGRYNIPNVGIALWRLNPYDIESALPRADASDPDRRFRFHPVGIDAPLFNPPRVESDPLAFGEDVHVPDALPMRALARELNARRTAIVNNDDLQAHFFAGPPLFGISVAGVPVLIDQVLIADLSAWPAVPAARNYRRRDGVDVPLAIAAAVDPVLGRFAFPNAVDPADVRVSFTYAFAADLGGGPYDRSTSVQDWLDPVRRPVTFQVAVSALAATVATSNPPHSIVFSTLAAANDAWLTHVTANPGAFGVITILDSSTYQETLTGADRIEVPAGSRLALVAADWPRADAAGPGGPFRPRGNLTATGVRPHIRGDVSVCGTDAPDEVMPDGSTRTREPGQLIFDGLLIEGAVRVLVGNLGSFDIRHCTIVPAAGSFAVNPSVQPELQNTELEVHIERSIVGALTLPPTARSLALDAVILHGALFAPGAHLELNAVTAFGPVTALTMEASDTLFVAPVTIERRQKGCVRYSYVPAGSATARRFRCQPDLAASAVADPLQAAATRQRIAPMFTSQRYGAPGYAQLSERCALELRTGASDGAEMGAFNLVKQPQREANLRLRLREHLRVGLEAGYFYRT